MTNNNIKQFIFFDTETTGLNFENQTLDTVSSNDSMWELSLSKVDFDMTTNTFVNLDNNQNQTILCKLPRESFSPDIIRICHIDNEKMNQIQQSSPFSDIAKEIHDFIGDNILIAYNGVFDYKVLNSEFLKVGLPPLTNKLIDPMLWVISNTLTSQDIKLNTSLMQYKHLFKENDRLATAFCFLTGHRMEDVEDKAHAADFDVDMLKEIFKVMIKTEGVNTKNFILSKKDLDYIAETDFTTFKVKKDSDLVSFTNKHFIAKDALYRKFPKITQCENDNMAELWTINKNKFFYKSTPNSPLKSSWLNSCIKIPQTDIFVEGKGFPWNVITPLNFIERRAEIRANAKVQKMKI